MMTNSLSPIVLFTFNRPDHTLKTFEALKANTLASKSDIIVYCDGPRNDQDIQVVTEVRDLVRNLTGFKSVTVVESVENKGLAQSIISGVTEVVEKYGTVIVLEDDIVTSPFFLEFMDRCLTQYKELEQVFSIGGWSPPTFSQALTTHSIAFLPRTCSWGWATWEDRWKSVDWSLTNSSEFLNSKTMQKSFNGGGADMTNMLQAQLQGHINSWAIRFTFSQFMQNKLSVYPIKSYAVNIGCDGSGVHCNDSIIQQDVVLEHENDLVLPTVIKESKKVSEAFRNYYKPPSFYVRAINKLSRILIGKNIIS